MHHGPCGNSIECIGIVVKPVTLDMHTIHIKIKVNHRWSKNLLWFGWMGRSSVLRKVVLNMVWQLTHWGRVTHICVSKLTIIGSDNGLSPGRRQAIIWTNDGIVLIGPLRTNFSEILIEIYTFSFKKMHFKMSSGNGCHFVSASMC